MASNSYHLMNMRLLLVLLASMALGPNLHAAGRRISRA